MEKGKFYGKTINRRRMSRLKKGKNRGDLGMEHDYPTQDTIKLIFKDYNELKETIDKIM